MKKGWLGMMIATAVLTAALVCGGAMAAASANAAADGPFSNTLALVLLKVDSDSDSELTPLAPLPSAVILQPGVAGIFQQPRVHRPASAPRYTFVQPRSPPCRLPRLSQ